MTVVTTTHASGLQACERSLDLIHEEMLRSAAEEAGQVRLAVLNVVAGCVADADANLAVRSLVALGARHPARVIVVRAYPDPGATPAIEAEVSLQRTDVGDHAVYTELMRLAVSGEPAFHLSSVLGPLLIPDIPTDLWVVGAPRLVQAFSDEVVSMCDRIIVDSGAYPEPAEPLRLIAGEVRRRGEGITVTDIAWERVRSWRELIAQAFEATGAIDWLRQDGEVRISCAGQRVPAQAWLLAGWLAAQLHWEAGAEPLAVDLEPDAGDNRLCALSVHMHSHGGECTISVESTEGTLHIVSDAGGSAVKRSLPDRSPDLTSLISRLLDGSRVDRVYPRAVSRAAALIR